MMPAIFSAVQLFSSTKSDSQVYLITVLALVFLIFVILCMQLKDFRFIRSKILSQSCLLCLIEGINFSIGESLLNQSVLNPVSLAAVAIFSHFNYTISRTLNLIKIKLILFLVAYIIFLI